MSDTLTVNIKIDLGNDAMATSEDAARAIKGKMRVILEAVADGRNNGGKIMDDNGNGVGTWEVKGE